jgi:hypothetical protein
MTPKDAALKAMESTGVVGIALVLAVFVPTAFIPASPASSISNSPSPSPCRIVVRGSADTQSALATAQAKAQQRPAGDSSMVQPRI